MFILFYYLLNLFMKQSSFQILSYMTYFEEAALLGQGKVDVNSGMMEDCCLLDGVRAVCIALDYSTYIMMWLACKTFP